MTPLTLLLRQVHPDFVINGRVTSQAFRPSPKDMLLLSVENGDLIDAKSAWERFNSSPNKSVGVQALTHEECCEQKIPVIEDARPYPEHCSLDFSGFSRAEMERKAKRLRDNAAQRGWLSLLTKRLG